MEAGRKVKVEAEVEGGEERWRSEVGSWRLEERS